MNFDFQSLQRSQSDAIAALKAQRQQYQTQVDLAESYIKELDRAISEAGTRYTVYRELETVQKAHEATDTKVEVTNG